MRSASRFGSFLLFAPLLLLPLGCGGVTYKLAPVSGHVTMDSRPLANASISFYPNGASEFPASTGRTDDGGNFKLETFDRGASRDGAVIGESRVVISINAQNAGKKIDPARKQLMGRPTSSETGDLVPARYNTETTLKFTVPTEGSDQANFALTSKAH